MVLGMRTQRRYDVMFQDGVPKLVDVTEKGESYGYDTVVQMREAVRIGAIMSRTGPELALKRFDALIKRLLTGKLTSEDVIHHSKVRF